MFLCDKTPETEILMGRTSGIFTHGVQHTNQHCRREWRLSEEDPESASQSQLWQLWLCGPERAPSPTLHLGIMKKIISKVLLRMKWPNSCEVFSTVPAVLLCTQRMVAILKPSFTGNYKGTEKPFSNFEGNTIIVASRKCTVQRVCNKCIVYI